MAARDTRSFFFLCCKDQKHESRQNTNGEQAEDSGDNSSQQPTRKGASITWCNKQTMVLLEFHQFPSASIAAHRSAKDVLLKE